MNMTAWIIAWSCAAVVGFLIGFYIAAAAVMRYRRLRAARGLVEGLSATLMLRTPFWPANAAKKLVEIQLIAPAEVAALADLMRIHLAVKPVKASDEAYADWNAVLQGQYTALLDATRRARIWNSYRIGSAARAGAVAHADVASGYPGAGR